MYKLSSKLKLPDRFPTMKMGILGRTGSGKTNTAVVLAEQMIANHVPIAILDPQGDWWGLREKYQIAILGGEHGDVPLEPTGGTIAADFVINERIPVLLDLFTMGEGEMVRFATDFAKRLWTKNRQALHVFLDEADLFAPQRSMGADKNKCLSAWQNVCRRGRSRGIGLTMITQRSAVINKDLLTQADPMIVHRLTAPQDLSAVDDFLKYHGFDSASRNDVTARVAKLEVGSALVLSPGELEIEPSVYSIPKRESFDSGATPSAGETLKAPKSFADVDLVALESAMAETIQRAKNSDPKELNKKIRELEKQLKAQGKVVDENAIENAVNRALSERDKFWKRQLDQLKKQHDHHVSTLQTIHDLTQLNGNATFEPNTLPPTRKSGSIKHVDRPEKPTARSTQVSTPSHRSDLPKAEYAVLRALFWLRDEEITIFKIGFYSGYSIKSSAFTRYIKNLQLAGLIEGYRITDDGIEMLGGVSSKPQGDELREWLRPKLGNAENAILDVLQSEHSQTDNETLAERSGYSLSSSAWPKYLKNLKSLGAIVGNKNTGFEIAEELVG